MVFIKSKGNWTKGSNSFFRPWNRTPWEYRPTRMGAKVATGASYLARAIGLMAQFLPRATTRCSLGPSVGMISVGTLNGTLLDPDR
jgi:hypothetical protein